MIDIKPGVKFHRVVDGKVRDLNPVMAIAFTIIAHTYNRLGYSCTITSGMEGKHKEGSLHYKGRALDFRTRNIPEEHRGTIRDAVVKAMGPDFDVVLHKTHMHVEYDPKE